MPLAIEPVSVLLAVPGLWCIDRYRLKRERHAENLRELAERRQPAVGPETLAGSVIGQPEVST
ncbi:MAG: hypothetical protein P8Y69_14425 [Gammaproteobacteria bacterium]